MHESAHLRLHASPRRLVSHGMQQPERPAGARRQKEMLMSIAGKKPAKETVAVDELVDLVLATCAGGNFRGQVFVGYDTAEIEILEKN